MNNSFTKRKLMHAYYIIVKTSSFGGGLMDEPLFVKMLVNNAKFSNEKFPSLPVSCWRPPLRSPVNTEASPENFNFNIS